MPGPSAVPIVLTNDERAELVRRAGLPERRRADRARIVLACADGMSNAGAAQALEVAVKSGSKWRGKCVGEGVAGLENSAPTCPPRAGPGVGGAQAAHLSPWPPLRSTHPPNAAATPHS